MLSPPTHHRTLRELQWAECGRRNVAAAPGYMDWLDDVSSQNHHTDGAANPQNVQVRNDVQSCFAWMTTFEGKIPFHQKHFFSKEQRLQCQRDSVGNGSSRWKKAGASSPLRRQKWVSQKGEMTIPKTRATGYRLFTTFCASDAPFRFILRRSPAVKLGRPLLRSYLKDPFFGSIWLGNLWPAAGDRCPLARFCAIWQQDHP